MLCCVNNNSLTMIYVRLRVDFISLDSYHSPPHFLRDSLSLEVLCQATIISIIDRWRRYVLIPNVETIDKSSETHQGQCRPQSMPNTIKFSHAVLIQFYLRLPNFRSTELPTNPNTPKCDVVDITRNLMALLQKGWNPQNPHCRRLSGISRSETRLTILELLRLFEDDQVPSLGI